VLGLWWVLRRRFSLRVHLADLRPMLHFGLPTVPAEASVYALQVADRFYLFRVYSHSAAGLYSVAIKLATVVFVAVRGFQYAWPPLAYSVESDEEAARLYSLVTTYYALATGIVVCGVALLGRCTGSSWCSWSSLAGRASPHATSLPPRSGWRSTWRCSCCSCPTAGRAWG
jgi:O-antigen/teichoic acid export membrane protein